MNPAPIPASRVIRALALALLLAAGGCGREPTLDPPDVAYGKALCERCGMIVSDERFATAMIVDRGGEILPVVFDDIGDMLEYERDAGPVVLRRYVHDHETGDWLNAERAVYVWSDALRTPMASGLAAFAGADAAQAAAEGLGGETLSYPDLAARYSGGE